VGQRAVLFDVDGTLLDVLANQRSVWRAWAARHALDPDHVYATAVRTVPLETFAAVAPAVESEVCLASFQEIEDEDARNGEYSAFAGAGDLLSRLPPGAWGLVTSNYADRVAIRFERLGLPMPEVLVDAEAVKRGKPDPEGYLAAARDLGRAPSDCLVVEDGEAGVQAGLAAGMTVWAVNAGASLPGAHRRYASLQAAAPDITGWVMGAEPI
jgi:sugar-phosphatase